MKYQKPSTNVVQLNQAGLVALAQPYRTAFPIPPEDCGYKTTPDSFVEKTCVTLDSQFTKGLNINNLNTNFQYPGVTVQTDNKNQCTADIILVGQGSQVTMQIKPTGQIATCKQGNDVQTTASLSGDKYCIDIDQQFTLIFTPIGGQGSFEDNGRVKSGNNVDDISMERTDTGDKSDTSQACTRVNDPNW